MALHNDTSPDSSAVRLPSHVVYRTFVSETVLLNLKTGKYHGLNRSAGHMLEVLDELGDLQTASERLAADFDQPLEIIQRDLRAFCADLLERGLVEIDPADG